ARMRIEPGQHAVDRRFDELAVVGFLDVIGAHPLEHVAEQIELPVSVRGCGLCARSDEYRVRLCRQQCEPGTCDRTQENEGSFAHHPRTFSPSFVAHHGLGSMGAPSLRNSTYRTGCLGTVVTVAEACDASPITATGSPVSTNWPRSTEIRSI